MADLRLIISQLRGGQMIKIILAILLFTVPVFAGDGIGEHIEIGKDIYSDVTYTDLRIDYQFTFWNIHLVPY